MNMKRSLFPTLPTFKMTSVAFQSAHLCFLPKIHNTTAGIVADNWPVPYMYRGPSVLIKKVGNWSPM